MRNKISYFLQKYFSSLYIILKKIRNKLDVTKQKLVPYKFNREKFKNTFLRNDSALIDNYTKVPRKIFIFWTGDNEMSENRKNSIESLKIISEIDIILVTKDNLNEFIKLEYPLHPAYEYLSFIHRADYLRCYFMHHYGGGYADIKPFFKSWKKYFEFLEESDDKYFVSYPENRNDCLAKPGGEIGKELIKYFTYLGGNCAYIFKPYTKFTDEWITELHKRLDNYYEALKNNPGDARGRNKGYPIPFFDILGNIYHPLCLKYSDKLILTEDLRPNTTNYL